MLWIIYGLLFPAPTLSMFLIFLGLLHSIQILVIASPYYLFWIFGVKKCHEINECYYYNHDVSFMHISESLTTYISLFVIFSMHFWSEYIANHRWISSFDWVGVEFSDFHARVTPRRLAPNNIHYLPLEAICRSFSISYRRLGVHIDPPPATYFH